MLVELAPDFGEFGPHSHAAQVLPNDARVWPGSGSLDRSWPSGRHGPLLREFSWPSFRDVADVPHVLAQRVSGCLGPCGAGLVGGGACACALVLCGPSIGGMVEERKIAFFRDVWESIVDVLDIPIMDFDPLNITRCRNRRQRGSIQCIAAQYCVAQRGDELSARRKGSLGQFKLLSSRPSSTSPGTLRLFTRLTQK